MSDENAVAAEAAEEPKVPEAGMKTADEAIEEAAEGDAGKAPEGGALAIKDERYLGAGVKVSDPDADGFQAITFLIDSRTQHTYIFGPNTAAYMHDKTLSPEARALLEDVPDPAEAAGLVKPGEEA